MHTCLCLGNHANKKKKHPKTLIKPPTRLRNIYPNYSQIALNFSTTTGHTTLVVIEYSHPPSVVDSRRPLFNAAFRSSVARSRNASKHQSVEALGLSSAKPTAASSTGIAPFAMLCLPGRGLLANGRIDFVPSCCSRSLRHSSSVVTYPSSNAKNLCRSTVLIRSRARLVNHPSRS